MSRQRLPWIKLWEQAIDHPKIALLPDPLFRTWVHVLSKASQQPTRWQFANDRHAAQATSRPLGQIRQLVRAGLLDAAEGGRIVVHDWRDWQEVYPSDLGRPPRQNGRNGRAQSSELTPNTLRESSELAPNKLGINCPEIETGDRDVDGDVDRSTRTTPDDSHKSRTTRGRGVQGGRTPTAGAVGRPAAAGTAPEISTNGALAKAARPARSGVSLAPLLEAFKAAGLPRPALIGQEIRAAQELVKLASPDEIAACWADFAGSYGDEYDHRHLSFGHLLARNRLVNWQRERGEPDPDEQARLVGRVTVRRY